MPIASTVNGIFGLIGNEQQFASSKKLMQKQHHYNKKYAQYVGTNAHQWTVQDLKAAGLNPVLSATQGANATNGGNVGLPQAPDYAGSLQSAVQTYMDAKRIKNEKEIAESTADLNDANANKARKETGVIDAKTNQDIKESESRIVKNKAETNEIKSKMELNQAEKDFTKQKLISELGTLNNIIGSGRINGDETIKNMNTQSAEKNKKKVEQAKKRKKEIEDKLKELGYEIPNLSQ